MANLTTKYMGLELKNPIIVGASNLVTDVNNLKKIEEAGAAAIVYKSLFEEQVQLETYKHEEEIHAYNERFSEMSRIFPNIEHAGPLEFLMNLKKAKDAVSIPVFASLNCVNHETWAEYAIKLAETGIDGLEINLYHFPKDFSIDSHTIEEEQVEIVSQVKKAVKIPVSVKLSPYYTNVLNVIDRMAKAGADAFVLFNRLFQPEIVLEKEEHEFPWNLSHEGDNRLSLRYAGLLYDQIKASICCNTGIMTGKNVVQMILAGADTVQVVSALYKYQIGHITTMLGEVEKFMNAKNYKSIDDFKGKLSRAKTKDPFIYKRAQYVDILFNSKNILESFPMR
jgi:dihydroorotate dehydrogenase (fumarate)